MDNLDEKIYSRNIIAEIAKFLDDKKIIVLHGARQVGKTHILYHFREQLVQAKKQCLYLDLEDDTILDILNRGVESFLNYLQSQGLDLEMAIASKQPVFVLIDEVQYMEKPSKFMKLIADHHKYLKLIVSGSSSFDIKKKFTDSLVGRIVSFEVYPLNFAEFLDFKEIKINLEFAAKVPEIREKLVDLYQEYMLYGGYPDVVLEKDVSKKEAFLKQIKQTYVDKDIKDLAKIRETSKFNNLLKILAERSGQLLNLKEVCELTKLNYLTLEKYLFVLENTYIIKLVRPYSNIAQNEIIKMPKVFFYDTGLMQIIWFRKLNQANVGNIFETSVFSEIVKKYGTSSVYFWRTKSKNEVDFILDLPEGLIPVEAKLTLRQSDLSGITRFSEKYKIDKKYVVGLFGQAGLDMVYPWEL